MENEFTTTATPFDFTQPFWPQKVKLSEKKSSFVQKSQAKSSEGVKVATAEIFPFCFSIPIKQILLGLTQK